MKVLGEHFPNEAKLAPTSNSNLGASLRAILEAQSLGEKGGTFTNAWSRNQDYIHPYFHKIPKIPLPFTNTPLGLTSLHYPSKYLFDSSLDPLANSSTN